MYVHAGLARDRHGELAIDSYLSSYISLPSLPLWSLWSFMSFIAFIFHLFLFGPPSFGTLSHAHRFRAGVMYLAVQFFLDGLPCLGRQWGCDLSLVVHGGGSLQVRPDGSAGPASPFSASLPYPVRPRLLSSFASNAAVQHEKASKCQLATGLDRLPPIPFFSNLVPRSSVLGSLRSRHLKEA